MQPWDVRKHRIAELRQELRELRAAEQADAKKADEIDDLFSFNLDSESSLQDNYSYLVAQHSGQSQRYENNQNSDVETFGIGF